MVSFPVLGGLSGFVGNHQVACLGYGFADFRWRQFLAGGDGHGGNAAGIQVHVHGFNALRASSSSLTADTQCPQVMPETLTVVVVGAVVLMACSFVGPAVAGL